MVPSHRELGFAEVAALFPWDWIFGESLLATLGSIEDKVMAGETPANPATMARLLRGSARGRARLGLQGWRSARRSRERC